MKEPHHKVTRIVLNLRECPECGEPMSFTEARVNDGDEVLLTTACLRCDADVTRQIVVQSSDLAGSEQAVTPHPYPREEWKQ